MPAFAVCLWCALAATDGPHDPTKLSAEEKVVLAHLAKKSGGKPEILEWGPHDDRGEVLREAAACGRRNPASADLYNRWPPALLMMYYCEKPGARLVRAVSRAGGDRIYVVWDGRVKVSWKNEDGKNWAARYARVFRVLRETGDAGKALGAKD